PGHSSDAGNPTVFEAASFYRRRSDRAGRAPRRPASSASSPPARSLHRIALLIESFRQPPCDSFVPKPPGRTVLYLIARSRLGYSRRCYSNGYTVGNSARRIVVGIVAAPVDRTLNRAPHRIFGFDVARSLAILGMVVVHFSLVMSADQSRP